jgi:hypothetical protein
MMSERRPSPLLGANQLTLYAGAALTIDETFGSAVRRDLDEASRVEVVPGWAPGSETRRCCVGRCGGRDNDRMITSRSSLPDRSGRVPVSA